MSNSEITTQPFIENYGFSGDLSGITTISIRIRGVDIEMTEEEFFELKDTVYDLENDMYGEVE